MSLDRSRTLFCSLQLYCIFNQRIICVLRLCGSCSQIFYTQEPLIPVNYKQTKLKTRRRQKLNLKVKMVWSKYAVVLTQVPLKILQISYVPFTQVLPVHPTEQLHVSGETQDPRQLSHPWEQIAVK